MTLTRGELLVTQDLTIDGDRDGNGLAVTIDGNSAGRVLHITGKGTDVALTDLTLAHGRSPTDDFAERGGAVLLEGGSLVINAATIRDSICGASGYSNGMGGGIFAGGGSRLTINSSNISGNEAPVGAGIAADGKVRLTIRNSQITGNGKGSPYAGGGIQVSGKTRLQLEDSVISDNGSAISNDCCGDGGISINGSFATIDRSNITRNIAQVGAGIYSFRSHLSIVDSTISNNIDSGSDWLTLLAVPVSDLTVNTGELSPPPEHYSYWEHSWQSSSFRPLRRYIRTWPIQRLEQHRGRKFRV